MKPYGNVRASSVVVMSAAELGPHDCEAHLEEASAAEMLKCLWALRRALMLPGLDDVVRAVGLLCLRVCVVSSCAWELVGATSGPRGAFVDCASA